MTFIALWSSIILVVTAVVLSLLLWSRQRDVRALLLTGLLAAIAARFLLLGARVVWDLDEVAPGFTVVGVGVWIQLVTASLGVAAVVGLDRLLNDERRRRLAIGRVQRSLEEISFGLPGVTGLDFCRAAVERVDDILGTDLTLIGELMPGEKPRIRVVAISGEAVDDELTYDLAGTPCEAVVGREPRHYAKGVHQLFPDDSFLAEHGIEAYIGVPLEAAEERPTGILAIMNRTPLEDPAVLLPALRIVAARVQTELQRAQQDSELQASERRFRELFEESQDALYISAPDGSMIDANPVAVELFGYPSREELMHQFYAPDHYNDPIDREVILAHLMRDEQVRDFEIKLKRRDGTVLDVLLTAVTKRDENGKLEAIRGSLRDVTEQRQLEEQLLRSQRLEAVGRMAGGVAHDFNNMLTVIQGQSELLAMETELGSEAAQSVEEINGAVRRAAAFTRRLLLLSRRQQVSPHSVDINLIVQELGVLLQSAIGTEVELHFDLGHDIDKVIADPTEIEQVLLNLAINARDAMPDGGRVTISTRNVARPAELEPGDRWVELAVADDGCGIDEAVQEQIFEPFFTTKDPAVGTGLGLATVHGIVRQLGGHVYVDSTPGEGTRFSLFLPAASSQELIEPAVIEERGATGGSERLLVVDDEPGVRLVLQRFLEDQGYEVVVASSGHEALDRIREVDGFDLMISDVMMPGMTGPKLIEKARAHHEQLPVLLISGFASASELDNSYPLLHKPFTTRELGRRIREVLAAAG